MNVIELMRLGPVIPVIVIEDADRAVPLARALVAGGVRVLEVTLRTPAALSAIRAIAREVPEAVVGVGTLTHADEFAAALEAGAQFAVSPGLTPALVKGARTTGLRWLPGVMTPSDVIAARAAGLCQLKLFPAQQAFVVEATQIGRDQRVLALEVLVQRALGDVGDLGQLVESAT